MAMARRIQTTRKRSRIERPLKGGGGVSSGVVLSDGGFLRCDLWLVACGLDVVVRLSYHLD